MPRSTIITRYALPAGALLIIQTWKNGEQMLEAVVDGQHVAGALIRKDQKLVDARPVIVSPETTSPENVRALGEALVVLAHYIVTGKINERWIFEPVPFEAEIGNLVRNGKTIYYATVNDSVCEFTSRPELVEVIRGALSAGGSVGTARGIR